MPLTPGTRLGPYEIVGPLGAGGMGEVFRARDPRLDRDVAIKALPAAFAHDPERLARFEREAKLLASLSHPNIAPIFGLEEAGGGRYLALELVEGETLASRLARGPLPLDEALDVARQVAAGVEAAHESDVVHRDLKPGNVMLRADGTVKVLDFGLAKSGGADRSGVSPDLLSSPTMAYAGTEAGVILGTAAYMSPEQARGKPVDKRTDVWSFGCVLYECLTGGQAFAGETVSDIVARILQTEPEWAKLPAATPARLRALLARCLEKDPRRRLRDIGEARIELEDLIVAPGTRSGVIRADTAAVTRPAAGAWAVVAYTTLVAAAAAGFGALALAPKPAPPPVTRLEVLAPKNRTLWEDGAAVALSPDGMQLAMLARDSSGTLSIWVRRLDTLAPRLLPGTAGAGVMFWSPDSRSIGFTAYDKTLSTIALDGGAPQRVCATKVARGGAWGPDGTLLVAPYSNGGIYRVPATGGTPVQVTHPDTAHGVTGHRFPVFLPDGKHFLFSAVPAGPDGKGGLCMGSVDGGPTQEIARLETGVAWVDPHWLVTTRGGSLIAWRFDAGARRLVGEPVVLGDRLVPSSYAGGPAVSASRGGMLAFLTLEDVPMRVSWYDPWQGRELDSPPLPVGLYSTVSLAPDGRRAALGVQTEPGRSGLLLADLERGVTSPISEESDDAESGVWSRDGTQVAYVDDWTQNVRVRSLTDGSLRSFLAEDRAYKRVNDFTPDGTGLLYARLDAATKWDLWLLPLGGGPPRPCLKTPANEPNAKISPDGRWLKYASDESGAQEVFVGPFMASGPKYQVTIGGLGGGFSGDGKRFYYAQQKDPGAVLVADVIAGSSFATGPPRLAFRLPAEMGPWDRSSDEKRILRLQPAEKPAAQAVTVMMGWRGDGRGKPSR